VERDAALALVRERVPNANLVNHCVAAEIIMEAIARHFGLSDEDVAKWGLAGLLHDLDYADTAEDPARHARIAADELSGVVDAEVVHAILAHAGHVPCETRMDRALYAADPLTGFIVAAALVRPDKSLAGVELRSLKKRWNERAFARGACRDQMDTCESLGIERDEFLGIALHAMRERAHEIGL